MSLEDLKNKLVKFRDELDWKQFHNPKDLAIAISVESNELLELFQWKDKSELNELLTKKREEIGEELADILLYLISFSDITGINLYEEAIKKIEKNRKKYPLDKFKGIAKKYDES